MHGMYKSSQVCVVSIENSIGTLVSSQGCLVLQRDLLSLKKWTAL
jgi:hypothetical protein